MATSILTPANVARYLEWKSKHDHFERLCKSWHDAFKLELITMGQAWTQDGYSAALREYQRPHFQHKLLLVQLPDIHEQFLTTLTVQALIVTGPRKLTTPEAFEVPRMIEEKPPRKGYVRRLIDQQMGPDEEMAS